MQLVWGFLKVVIVVGILAAGGWFIYQKANEGPATTEDVKEIALFIAQIVGSEKPELTSTDKPSVEFQVDKLKDIDLETIRDGLCLLDPGATRAQYVSAELIMLRIYDKQPEGYVSRIDGEAWDVSGDIAQMGPFDIDRTPGDADVVSEMVRAFGSSVNVRSSWPAKPKAK